MHGVARSTDVARGELLSARALHGDRLDTTPGRAASEPPRPERRRSAGIWSLAFVNLALAAASFGFVRFLAGTERYLLNESAEFGSDLAASQGGLLVLKVAAWALCAGFSAAALGVVSLTRAGRFMALAWSVMLGLTLVGLLYAIPSLVALTRPSLRDRFSRPDPFAPED